MAKNYTKGYSDTQVSASSSIHPSPPPFSSTDTHPQTKVRDATSNDPWGPSGTQMNEVAQLTYNQ